VVCAGGCPPCATTAGWLFTDLRDRYGVTQVVLARQRGAGMRRPAPCAASRDLCPRQGRPATEGMQNSKLPTGEIEGTPPTWTPQPGGTPPFEIVRPTCHRDAPEVPLHDLRRAGDASAKNLCLPPQARAEHPALLRRSRIRGRRDADPHPQHRRAARANFLVPAGSASARSTPSPSRRSVLQADF